LNNLGFEAYDHKAIEVHQRAWSLRCWWKWKVWVWGRTRETPWS